MYAHDRFAKEDSALLKFSTRLGYVLTVSAILAVAVVLRIADPTPVAHMRNIVFDSYQRLSPRQVPARLPVRIIDIDDASLAALGQWPWPRSHLADIVVKLKALGAVAIGIDILFPEPDRLSPDALAKLLPAGEQWTALKRELATLPGNDSRFADAIAGAPVVMGFDADPAGNSAAPPRRAGFAFAGDNPLQFVPKLAGLRTSLPLLNARAKGSGGILWLPDRDQIVRRLPVMVAASGRLYPSFAAEVVRVAKAATTYIVKSSGASGVESFGERTGVSEVRIGPLLIATDAEGQLWLHFSRHDQRRFISARRLFDGTLSREEIAGRIVLIGSSAAGLQDLRSTPLDALAPGVEIHAQAIEQILAGQGLSRPDFALGAELAFLLAAGILLALLIRRTGAASGALVGASFLAAVTLASWLAFTTSGWLLDPVYPTLAVLVLYLAATFYQYLRAETDRSRIRVAFSHYMAPSLVDQLADHPELLRLGGETRELTILFADVRGFTSLCEGLSAEEVTSFLNRLFTPLSTVVLEHRGTIDKYIGDAVMAFWNAPLDDPDHARNACLAALGMQEALAVYNQDRAREAGGRATPIALGFGINTGSCCVGNFGSVQRFDYSAIGDSVNVASRLESLTKLYGVAIIVGETTMLATPGLAFLEIDMVQVKGRQEPSRIFALIGDATVAVSPEFARLAGEHASLIAALRGADPTLAAAAIAHARQTYPKSLADLLDYYECNLTNARDSEVTGSLA
ncbi:MAG: adenylate/guanylate cyclase domain-containing protein [Hyphomicrobiaceae bacterium]